MKKKIVLVFIILPLLLLFIPIPMVENEEFIQKEESFLATPFSSSSDGWIEQFSGTTEDLNDVIFVDENNGWCVGTYGTILNTLDGGVNWFEQTSGTTEDLNAVDFISSEVGWVVGNDVILKTTDGGATWTNQDPLLSQYFHTIDMIDADEGWVGEYSGLWYTSTGGTIWTKSSYFGCVKDLCILDTNDGYFVDGILENGNVYNTTDGGTTWTETHLTSGYTTGVDFIDYWDGWVIGEDSTYNGKIWKTDDAGETWIDQTPTGFMMYPRDIEFIDYWEGWVVGISNEIWYTSDGGTSWIKQREDLFGGYLTGVSLINSTHGWAVGDGGIILHTTNGGFTEITVISPTVSDNWLNGEHDITWDSSVPFEYVIIELYKETTWIEEISWTVNDGIYTWTIYSFDDYHGNDYRIKISDYYVPDTFAWSDYFSINNQIPTASFTVSSNTVDIGENVIFTDTTTDGDLPLSYQWDFDDGSADSIIQSPTHSYSTYGIYTVTLIVQDFDGDISIFSQNITVINTAPDLSHPNDVNYEVGSSDNSISWTVTDVSIGTTTYTIYQDGVSEKDGTWTTGTPIVINIDGLAIGTYNFTIVVEDGLGGINSDEVKVTVSEKSTTTDTDTDTDGTNGIPSYPIALIGLFSLMTMFFIKRNYTRH